MKSKVFAIIILLASFSSFTACSEEEVEPTQWTNKNKGQGSDSMDPHQWD